MKKIGNIALVALLATGVYLVNDNNEPVVRDSATVANATSEPRSSDGTDDVLANAFETRATGIQVQGSGSVVRILPDDNDGSRHQRFIIRLSSGQTLLVAHNIDLAPRIASLETRDRISFYGEYEWNPQGGVIHWTHRDPDGRHAAGWIRHEGQTYQ